MEEQTFDYVIVGGGTAGCALAGKLAEDRTVTVCVLEAGPSDRHPMIRIPAGFTKTVGNPKFIWPFETEPTAETGNRPVPFVQGRVLGGSSSINGMIYIRGQRADYDGWAKAGNPGWSYADVLPYFKSMENRPGGDPDYSGTSGPLSVQELRWRDPVCQAFIEAAQENGMPLNSDYNGQRQHGVAYVQTTMSKHRRVNSALAFLRPAMARQNLTVITSSVANRIKFEGNRAVGVSYTQGGVSLNVRARREVIISAGTINTARLLQISGVGDPQLLGELGVPVVAALKGVGKNLHDHYLCFVTAEGKDFVSINQLAHGARLYREVARYFLGAQSILELPPVLIHWFEKTSLSDNNDADIEGVFTPTSSVTFDKEGSHDEAVGVTLAFWQHRPKSRGHVRAVSTNISDPPIIQPRYLQHELDRATLLAGFARARSLLGSKALSPFITAEGLPGKGITSDSELLEYAGRCGATAYHFVGTAKMGPKDDPMSVVDSKLRVYGADRLRVADCSILPSITSANLMATAMMVGLKAADYIREAARSGE